MNPSRRRLLRGTAKGLAIAALAAPALPRRAQAADVTWRLAHTAPEPFPVHQRLLQAAAEIAEASGARMIVKIFPDRQLGDPMGQLGQVRAGTLDATILSGQILSVALPSAATASVGFAFSGQDKVWPAMDGGLGKVIRAEMQSKLGIFASELVWDFGFRHITTQKRPIRSSADLSGLRIRTPREQEFISLFQALKAIPLSVEVPDLYKVLRNGAVDGQEGVLTLVQALRLSEVQSYCALTHHVWDGQFLCIAGQAWKGLPDDLKQIATTAFSAAAVRQREDTKTIEDALRDALTAKGLVFNAVDLPSFRASLKVAGYYQEARGRVGDDAWYALERYAGRLA